MGEMKERVLAMDSGSSDTDQYRKLTARKPSTPRSTSSQRRL